MKPYRLALAVLFLFSSCVHQETNNDTRKPTAVDEKLSSIDYDTQRGSPAEFDPGPPKDSQWPDIFAETPNYRAYGKAIYRQAAESEGLKDDTQEKFRWKVGPMWYRGRLTPESVKVFVIGQEGAQDENVSNRTFTGSTGTKIQNFLNYFGVNRSYLFMNTFIYTITGQYGEKAEDTDSAFEKKQKENRSEALRWIAQNESSVIVKHRHRMFDYMREQNKNTLRLIIGVGSAGKDSLVTWIRSHGGKCTVQELSSRFCDASVIAPGAKAIGVMHPGAASARNGGSDAANSLRGQFAARAEVVAKWMRQDSKWLPSDPGARVDLEKAYYYKDAGIPYIDFAFGTTWRMGNDGTATNRRGADGIQIYSANGCYNNAVRLPETGKCDFAKEPAKPKTLPLKYDEPPDLKSEMHMSSYDVPYESPKSKKGRRDYDVGPGDLASTLMGYTAGGWPDFTTLGVTQHKSFGYGAIYRGQLENPQVVILADQESHDDMFSTRALTGAGGQNLQKYLSSLGVNDGYAIIRTLPVDTMDLTTAKATEIALHPQAIKVRNSILDAVISSNTKLILTIGDVAKEALSTYQNSKNIKVVNLISVLDKAHIAQWNKEAVQISSLLGTSSTEKYNGDLMAIPRKDLPVHTRYWMGTSGSRAYRAYLMQGKNKVWNGDYYQFQAPGWVSQSKYPAKEFELANKSDEDPNNYVDSLVNFRASFRSQ